MMADCGFDRSFLPRSSWQKATLAMMQRKILPLQGIRNDICLAWEISTERKIFDQTPSSSDNTDLSFPPSTSVFGQNP